VGLLVGIFIALSSLPLSRPLALFVIPASVALCGWLSVYYGEDFWEIIRGFLHALRFIW